MASLRCPRCDLPMRRRSVKPSAAEASVSIDDCEGCGGLWLDHGEAAAICPTVARLDRRIVEIISLGKPGGGLPSCPRCDGAVYEFPVLHMHIDFCSGCHGVWLDAHEHDGRTRITDGSAESGGSPYRAIERAVSQESVPCLGCQQHTPMRAMYMSSEGLVCNVCYQGLMMRVVERRADDAGDGSILGSIFRFMLGVDG